MDGLYHQNGTIVVMEAVLNPASGLILVLVLLIYPPYFYLTHGGIFLPLLAFIAGSLIERDRYYKVLNILVSIVFGVYGVLLFEFYISPKYLESTTNFSDLAATNIIFYTAIWTVTAVLSSVMMFVGSSIRGPRKK